MLGLAERLRRDAIDVRLDQYVNGAPSEGWPRWMLNQLDTAEFVLVVCTETYYRRFRGHEEPGKGKGADWEGAVITQEIYDARSRTLKFVPVLFAPEDQAYIPEPLRGWTHYTLTSEAAYIALYDFLLGQAGVEPSPLGDPQRRQRRRGEPLTFGDSPDGSTTARPTPMPGPHAALKIWREKLAFLHEEEARTADSDQKFRLRNLIEEAQAKIREHEARQ